MAVESLALMVSGMGQNSCQAIPWDHHQKGVILEKLHVLPPKKLGILGVYWVYPTQCNETWIGDGFIRFTMVYHNHPEAGPNPQGPTQAKTSTRSIE